MNSITFRIFSEIVGGMAGIVLGLVLAFADAPEVILARIRRL